MNLTPEQQKELAKFPAALRSLIDAELAAGNVIEEIGHTHPAPPVGAFVKFTKKVTTRPRASGSGLKFYERNHSIYSGEFYDEQRFFFVLEPANPPPPYPDMDAIRKAHEPKPHPLATLAEREAGSLIDGQLKFSAEKSQPRPPVESATAVAEVVEETATSWTRVLHFADQRPPHEVKFALECELMVLFTVGMDGPQLRMHATAINGAQFDFELRFVAALKAENYFTLRTKATWSDTKKENFEYYRKSSKGWFDLWTRGLKTAALPLAEKNIRDRYQTLCEAALQADGSLNSVEAIHQAIIQAMKQGATYSNSHKEGGTNISWRVDHFFRSDYGDYPDSKIFRDEKEFLKMLRQFCSFEITRNMGRQELPELTAWKLVLRAMNPPEPSPLKNIFRSGAAMGAFGGGSTVPPKLATLTLPYVYSTPVAKWLGIALVVLIFAGLAAWQFVSIKSTGTPLGQALRTETHVFQLILTQERYLPSLHRNPSKDRYRIDLLAIPLANPAKQETFTLIRQQQANAATPMTKILGVDGDVVWINALSVFAVNLKTKHVASEAALRKANPELESFLHSARPEFAERFVMVSPDWSYAYEFSGETLKANACPPPDRGNFIDELTNLRIERSLCSGGVIGDNDWIAVATPEDAKSDFKVGFSLSRDFTPGEKDRGRQLYRGTADYSEKRPPIQSFAKLSEKEYRAATFLRTKPGGPIHRATNPDCIFLIHRVGTEYFAPYTLTRLALDGKELWSVDTGLGRLEQVLPGTNSIVLKGDRTPVPNKVPEPILVMVDVETGALTTLSLWQR